MKRAHVSKIKTGDWCKTLLPLLSKNVSSLHAKYLFVLRCSWVHRQFENDSEVEISCWSAVPCALFGNTMTQPVQIDFACDRAHREMKWVVGLFPLLSSVAWKDSSELTAPSWKCRFVHSVLLWHCTNTSSLSLTLGRTENSVSLLALRYFLPALVAFSCKRVYTPKQKEIGIKWI